MKGILFNTEMVRAILDGRKTVTRRVVKPKQLCVLESPYHKEHPETPDEVLIRKLCEPPYLPGEILYVRETWYYETFYEDMDNPPDLPSGNRSWRYVYKVDRPDFPVEGPGMCGWRPSIHMPREAARLFLRVTDVRVERLQAIKTLGTKSGIVQEGVTDCDIEPTCVGNCDTCLQKNSPRNRFIRLWNSTIKPKDRACYGWEANPWVWVVEFERIEKPKED